MQFQDLKMFVSQFTFLNEDISHDNAIHDINEEAFGPGRFARAAARIREQGPHDYKHSYICQDAEQIVGSVRMTSVWIGETKAYLLGPLAVRPSHKSKGVGGKLIELALNSIANDDDALVILVGDYAYYGPKGFYQFASENIEFPGPVDQSRILINKELATDEVLSGKVKFRDTESA
jgi:predicted N-acetyltransferase YhbS